MPPRIGPLCALAILSLFSSIPCAEALPQLLQMTEGSYTVPETSQAVLTLQNKADFDVICDVQVTGLIRGRDPVSGQGLVGRQASDSVVGFILKAQRKQERSFAFGAAVARMRKIWNDPQALLVEVDPQGLVSDCRALGGDGYPTCKGLDADPDGDGWGWEDDQSCKASDSSPTAGKWWSQSDGRWYPKYGSCSQYNQTSAWNCASREDNMDCIWKAANRECVPERAPPGSL